MNLLEILPLIAPVFVALVFIALTSLIKEPARRNFMAIMIAGAGAVYISGGGMGKWEFAFCTVLAYVSFRGLESYNFIGIGWHGMGYCTPPDGQPDHSVLCDVVARMRDLRSGDCGVVLCRRAVNL